MSHLKSVTASALVLAALGTAARAEQGSAFVLTFEELLPGGKDLVAYVTPAGDGMAGFAEAPEFNKASHGVNVRRWALDGGKLEARLGITVRPDFWVPADGKPIDGELSLTAEVADGTLTNQYLGTLGGKRVHGQVTGRTVETLDSSAARRFRLFLPQFLLRHSTYTGGEYKRDAWLTVAVKGGRGVAGHIIPSVPDYVAFTGLTRDVDLAFEAGRLTGTAAVDLRYNNPEKNEGVRRETAGLTLDVLAVADKAAGTCVVNLPGREPVALHVRGETTPPPKDPSEAVAHFTLHGGMTEDRPINAIMSTSSAMHGHAYAPRHNHQPHALDGSELSLDGGRLAGPVRISFIRDAYWSHEPFTNTYELDVRLVAGMLEGTFRGEDRGTELTGRVTGVLRARPAPPSGLEEVQRVELGLGYAMPNPPKGTGHHAKVVIPLEGGTVPLDGNGVAGAKVLGAKDAPLDAAVTRAGITLDGDRLQADVTYELTRPDGTTVTYRYKGYAIVLGEKLFGYWRGWRDGEPIYTKSAKLGGELVRK